MTLSQKITEWYATYKQKFQPIKSADVKQDTSMESSSVEFSPQAFTDLEIDALEDMILTKIPHLTKNSQKYVNSWIREPVTDIPELLRRQEAIDEIFSSEDESFIGKLSEVKLHADIFLYDREVSDNYSSSEAQNIATLANYVFFIDSVISNIKNPKSSFLKNILDSATKIHNSPSFQEGKRFVYEIYKPNNLAVTLASVQYLVRHNDSMNSIERKRKFFSEAKIVGESLEKLLTDESFTDFVDKEAKEINILETYNGAVEKMDKKIFAFERGYLDSDDLKKLYDMFEYVSTIVSEGMSAKIQRLDLGNFSEELGTYIAVAKLQKSWKNKGYPVTIPEFLNMKERRTEIKNSYNATLVNNQSISEVIPNDILSNPETNLFVIEGPNNGGKTTYIRQVGQMYWMAQLGMFLPAESAKLSIVDAIHTSIGASDNTQAGTGQYLTELNRAKAFTIHTNGHAKTTPYSLVFFDEFANGTDNAEGVLRTRIVLDHLSKKGVTSYFTTHKHEIGDMVQNGEIPGSMNLASEVNNTGSKIIPTHKVLRNAREKSYGHVIAEGIGITEENLQSVLDRELSQKMYDVADTRMKIGE